MTGSKHSPPAPIVSGEGIGTAPIVEQSASDKAIVENCIMNLVDTSSGIGYMDVMEYVFCTDGNAL